MGVTPSFQHATTQTIMAALLGRASSTRSPMRAPCPASARAQRLAERSSADQLSVASSATSATSSGRQRARSAKCSPSGHPSCDAAPLAISGPLPIHSSIARMTGKPAALLIYRTAIAPKSQAFVKAVASRFQGTPAARATFHETGYAPSRSARRHANGAVQADILAVQIVVFDHEQRETGIFFGPAEPLRERHLQRQRIAYLLGGGLQQRRVEGAGQDRVDADSLAHQVARDRQGHADDARLGRGIGGLANLAVLGRDRRRADDRAARIVLQRIEREHPRGRFGDAPERADQIDLDRAIERLDREMTDLAGFAIALGRLGRAADPGAVDQDPLLAVRRARMGEGRIDLLLGGDVHRAEHPAQFGGELFAELDVTVEDRHLDASRGERAHRRLAKPRRTTGNDGGNRRIEFHVLSFSPARPLRAIILYDLSSGRRQWSSNSRRMFARHQLFAIGYALGMLLAYAMLLSLRS